MFPAKLLFRITRASAVLSGIAILLMMLAGAADVIGTNLDVIGLRSQPIPATFEFMGAMMVVTVFLAVSFAQHGRRHIRVELLVRRMPPFWQKAADVLQFALGAMVFGMIARFAWAAAIHGFNVGEYATGIINFPLWPARFVMAFGVTLMTIQCLFDIAGVFSDRFNTRAAGSGDSLDNTDDAEDED